MTIPYGLAALAERLGAGVVTIVDAGTAYRLELSRPLDPRALDGSALAADPGFRYVKLKENDPDAPSGSFDLPAEQARRNAYRERAKELRKRTAGPALEERLADLLTELAPHPEVEFFGVCGGGRQLQGLGGANKAFLELRGADPRTLADHVATRLEWQEHAAGPAPPFPLLNPAAVQLYDPTAGKGINQRKPSGTSRGAAPPPDPFSQWMRYAGLQRAALAYRTGKSKSLKVVVPLPRRAESRAVGELRAGLLRIALRHGVVQLDVLAALHLARLLVERSEFGASTFPFGGRTPQDVIGGIAVAEFVPTPAYALGSLAAIGLPGWFPVDSREAANDWLRILCEHIERVRRLDESISDDAAVLHAYREFLSGGAAADFLDFAVGYGLLVFRDHEKDRPQWRLAALTLDNVRRLLMATEPGYGEILDDAGFQALARAIRLATVSEQFHKSRNQQVFEIRYGLYQELKRKARFKEQAVAALCDFVTDYNTENARRAEQLGAAAGRRRAQVTDVELDSIVRLVDRFGPEPVTMLLAAYASCRETHEHEPELQPEAEPIEPVAA